MASYAGGAHSAEVIATDGAGNTATEHWTINVDPKGAISTAEAADTLEAVDTTTPEVTELSSLPGVIAAGEGDPGLMATAGQLSSTGAPAPSGIGATIGSGFEVEASEGKKTRVT